MSELQNLRDKNGRCFCREQWEIALNAEFEKLGLRLQHYFHWGPEPRCVIWNSRVTSFSSNTPKAVQMWIENNPMPKISKEELIIMLAHRVERLEAALAEKGGDR